MNYWIDRLTVSNLTVTDTMTLRVMFDFDNRNPVVDITTHSINYLGVEDIYPPNNYEFFKVLKKIEETLWINKDVDQASERYINACCRYIDSQLPYFEELFTIHEPQKAQKEQLIKKLIDRVALF